MVGWRWGGFRRGGYRQGYGGQGLGQKWTWLRATRFAPAERPSGAPRILFAATHGRPSGAPRIRADGLSVIFIASNALPRDAFTKSSQNKMYICACDFTHPR